MKEKLDAMMTAGVADGVFPGAQLLVSRGESVCHFGAYGVEALSGRRPVSGETYFDLASLTKPLATALAVMALMGEGKLRLEMPLGEMLPPLGRWGKGRILLSNLLCHDSGLPAHRSYYERLREVPAADRAGLLWRLLGEERLERAVGERTVYSDLGFMVLSLAVAAAAGEGMDRYLARRIYGPLGISGLHFPGVGKGSGGRRYAATERCPWRGKVVRGEVHDDNAFAMGGVAGHAGLFGRAGDVHQLLMEILRELRGEGRGILDGALLARFLAPWGRTGRTLGFDRPSAAGSSCGRHFSRRTVGHLGFTGTSFWMDLEREIVVILLTNRVHPVRDNIAIRAFRPRIHDAVMEGMPVRCGEEGR